MIRGSMRVELTLEDHRSQAAEARQDGIAKRSKFKCCMKLADGEPHMIAAYFAGGWVHAMLGYLSKLDRL